MRELRVPVEGRDVMVRDLGDPAGLPVVHCHGTPGSRCEMDFAAEVATRVGVRIVSFDRPGYGRSDPAACSLEGVAGDVSAIADALDLGRFAVLGWSGGGPYALAAAAVLPDRVTAVGVSGGVGPVQHVPGAVETLTESDLLALSYLPDRPDRAVEEFLAGNQALLDGMMSVRDDEQAPWIDWMWSESDAEVVADPVVRRALATSFREALRQGARGIAWDNVAFVGPWGVDLSRIVCPVHLWYGSNDLMAPPEHGAWLADHLPTSELVVHEGEGHLLPFRHAEEMLTVLAGSR